MTLVTTPGDPNADSYATIAEADAYFTARGIATWTGSDSIKENALRRATTYLDNQYRGRWVGITFASTQFLAWPRVDGYRTLYRNFTYPLVTIEGWQIDSATVPVQVKRATMEAALLVLTGATLEPNLDRGGQIKSIGKSVGPLRKDIVYMDGAPAIAQYTAIKGLLVGLVNSNPGDTSGTVQIVRS